MYILVSHLFCKVLLVNVNGHVLLHGPLHLVDKAAGDVNELFATLNVLPIPARVTFGRQQGQVPESLIWISVVNLTWPAALEVRLSVETTRRRRSHLSVVHPNRGN